MNSIPSTYIVCLNTDNASRQYMALQIGTPYVFTDAERQAFRERLWTPALFRKTWDHYRSKL